MYKTVQLQIEMKIPNYSGVTTKHSNEYLPLNPLNR